MRLLVDTHCWLWMGVAPARLDRSARSLLEDGRNQVLLSSASSWEIAIKYATGQLSLPRPPDVYVPEQMQLGGVVALRVEHAHALHVASLPFHHRDPFDRLLIAQAQIERVAIMTVDRRFEPYDVEVIWAN